MKPKLLCPRWRKCKAKKKCLLDEKTLKDFDVYVKGKCVNKDVEVIIWFEDWLKFIEKV